MQPPPDSSNPNAGRRATSRLRVRLPAKVVTTHGTYAAVLDDLCYFGAKLSCDDTPAPGSEVLVQWGRFEGFGEVSWTAPGKFGVNFFDPVGPKVLLDTRDLDDVEKLPSAIELARRQAQTWARGR